MFQPLFLYVGQSDRNLAKSHRLVHGAIRQLERVRRTVVAIYDCISYFTAYDPEYDEGEKAVKAAVDVIGALAKLV